MKKPSINSVDPVAVQNGIALTKYLAWKKRNPPSEIEQLRFQAANALFKLRGLAKVDLKALEVLASELRHHVAGLKTDALKNPEHYRKLIRKCSLWPAFVCADKQVQNLQVKFAVEMQLGADSPINYRGRKKWDRNLPQNLAVINLIDWIMIRGETLPPLNKATARLWWLHAKPLFEQKYGADFEGHPLFARMFASNAHIKMATKRGQTIKGYRRGKILDQIEQAFKIVAPKI